MALKIVVSCCEKSKVRVAKRQHRRLEIVLLNHSVLLVIPNKDNVCRWPRLLVLASWHQQNQIRLVNELRQFNPACELPSDVASKLGLQRVYLESVSGGKREHSS